MDPLLQLKDIHLPAPVSFWPPAIGWWILALIALSSFIALCYFIFRHHQKNRYRRLAAQELKRLYQDFQTSKNTPVFTNKINLLLKQISVICYGKKTVARLTNSDWLTFLDTHGNTQAFTQGVGQVLTSAPYAKPTQLATINAEELYQCCIEWIRKHK